MAVPSPYGRESTVPIIELINEINILLQDYSHVHSAPKQVNDTLVDVKFLDATLRNLETLFGTDQLILHLPSSATEKLTEIDQSLKVDLERLHKLLKRWPDPPTFSAMITYGGHHNDEFKALREGFFQYQLSLTALLGDSSLLEVDPIETLPAVFEAPNLEPGSCSNGVHAQENGASLLPLGGSTVQEKQPAGAELVDILLTLPPTMRLSHLVQKLEWLQKASASPEFSALNENTGSVLKSAKELDQRLLKENHFSKDVQREITTTIDLEIKFLLHDLTTLGTLIRTTPAHLPSDDTLAMHSFMQNHRLIFVLILSLVAGSRLTHPDLRHHEGTVRGEEFEAAISAVMGVLARHSASINEWCGGRKQREMAQPI